MSPQEKYQQYLQSDEQLAQIAKYAKAQFDARKDLIGHSFEHARRDAINTIMIGEPEGADMSVVLKAALMHDIGFLYNAAPSEHGEIGAQKLDEFLSDGGINLAPEVLEAVRECIRTHKGVIHGVEPASLEAKVMADADHLDKYGPVAVFQSILALSEMGLKTGQIIGRFRSRKDLKFFTPTAAKIAEPLQPYIQQFAQDLEDAYEVYGIPEVEEKLI